MSITLKLKHLDTLRLRQQSAQKVERTENGAIVKGTEWKFDPDDCKQDEDQRKVGPDGKHEKLGTYTVYITAGLKNLVLELKGKVVHVDFRNGSLRNTLRIKYQKAVEVKDKKDEKKIHTEWRDEGTPQYIPANAWTGVFVGDGQRAIVDEMPT